MTRPASLALAALLAALSLSPALAKDQAASQPSAKTETKKEAAKKDEVVELNPDDPAVKAAVKKAQATFDDFIKTVSVQPPNPNIGNIAVRVALREGKKVEYVWLTPFTILKNGYKGRINAVPTIVKRYQFTQQVPFKREDVVDWMYTEADTKIMRGNFTTCAQLATAPESDVKEMKRLYGLDCSR